MNAFQLSHLVGLIALLGVLFGLIYLHLRASNLQSHRAALLGLVSLMQPAYLEANSAIPTVLFALAVMAVGVATLAFSKRQDPRKTVLLGGALAGAQIAHPIWGTAATIALPFTLHRSMGSGAERATGLYVSLLFVPAITTIALAYLAATGELQLPHWPGAQGLSTKIDLFSTVITILAGAIFLGAWLVLRKRPGRSALAIIGVLVLLVSVVLQVMGHDSELLSCAAAVGIVLLLMLLPYSASAVRFRTAMAVCATNAAMCWALAFIATRLEHAQ